MKRILTALILLLIAGIACAADGGDSIAQAKSFGAGLTPSSTDYSVAYLSQIFGTVGNVLQGTSGQVLGKMFDIFNKGVLVVAALWLCMTTVQMCLRAATEGSFMGQNKSVHMIMLRIALGFGLIIPSSATGYSVLQDLFMKIVVSGVALADQTWNAALNYLNYGGELYIPPGNLTTDTNVVPKAIGNSGGTPVSGTAPPSPALMPVTQIFQDEVCMIKSSSKAWYNAFTATTSGQTYAYEPIFDSHNGTIGFPGGTDSHSLTNATSASCGYAQSYYCAKGDGVGVNPCVQSTIISGQGQHSKKDPTRSAEFDYSYSALKQLAISLLPAAQNYVESLSSTMTDTTDADKSNAKVVFSGLLDYANLIMPYQNILTRPKGPQTAGFISNAEAQGWIMAGGFYWNVEQVNQSSISFSLSALFPTAYPPTQVIYNQQSTVASATTLNDAANKMITTYGTQIKGFWADYVGAQQNEGTARGSSAATSTTGPAGAMAGNALSDAVSNLFDLGQKGGYNPIVILMHMGNSLLITVVAIWVYAIVVSTSLAAVAGICNSTSPGGLVFKTAMGWIKSIMMLITSAMLIPGAIMAYYVPMYPFAIFTFAAIGWIGMVIEGMAAAPLVCLGMTHPEGHDFLGKAEQALMLFLSIFLRPTLMVIGMIAFMITSFVAFEMLMSGFGTLMNAFRSSQSGALNDDFLILISITMVMVIFGMMTMEVVEQCAKLIFQLPNNINKWIGAPGMGEEYAQMAGALKGGVSTGAEVSGRAASTLGVETGEVGGMAYAAANEQSKAGSGDIAASKEEK